MNEFKVPITPVASSEKKSTEVATLEDERNSEEPLLQPQKMQQNVASSEATCPYKIPPWSADPATDNVPEYKFEVLKSGQIIGEVSQLQRQAVWKFGRLPSNDIEMAHPTISRFHAVLQYRPASNQSEDKNYESKSLTEGWNENGSFTKGWYVFDLGSTHGTFLNKQRIPPKTFCRIKVGHMLRLGASTRCYILQGPGDDEEPESDLSVTELREQRLQQEKQRALDAQLQEEAKQREFEQAGVNWGMMEDADEETDLTVNPFASTNNEDFFLEDPKRTLRGFFEREGLDLVYKCDEMSAGSFVCRVELPLDDSNGRPIVVEVIHKGKKKETVVQCALEACRTLDRYGVLRQANQEPLKRKTKTTDSDDDDDFLDRTGDVERKKQRKKQTATTLTLTYEDLLKQESELMANLQRVQVEINAFQNIQKRQKATELESKSSEVDLDIFMENLDDDAGKKLDKIEVRKLRMEEQRLQLEHTKLQRLLKVAKPYELPMATNVNKQQPEESKQKGSSIKQQALIGRRNQFTKFKIAKSSPNALKPANTKNSAIQQYSDDENDDDDANKALVDASQISLHKVEENNTANDQDDTVKTQNSSKDQIIEEDKTQCREISSPVNIERNNDDANCETDEKNSCNSSVAGRKRRHRQRVRNKRTDIDELAAHESVDKYAKWVPPENQTGDGITELNKKFGY